MTNHLGYLKEKWKGLIESLKRFYLSERLLWYIIGLGILFRLYQYFYNRSLFVDEARLALIIMDSRLTDFLEPVAQPHPPGFFIIEKVITILFGNSEYALRLFPLISGIAAIFAFYYITRRLLDKRIAPIALAIFCGLYSLIYFSTEVKQYSSDVAIALILYASVLYLSKRETNISGSILFALIGAVAIWISYPSVFVLAGIGSILLLYTIFKREWKTLRHLVLVSSVWLLSFALLFFKFLKVVGSRQYLTDYLVKQFAPIPPMTASEFIWYIKEFRDIFSHKFLLGLDFQVLWLVIFLVGCIEMFNSKKMVFLLLIAPIPFALIASGLQKYPFHESYLLFIIPNIVLIISVGIWEVIDKTRKSPATFIVGIFIAYSLFSSFYQGGIYLVEPIVVEEIKPVLKYIEENKEEGDTIYCYYGAASQLKYYAERYNLDCNDVIIGVKSREKPEKYLDDINNLPNYKRVWLLFSHVHSKSINEKYYFLKHLNQMGELVDSYESLEASAYLYDFSCKEK